MHIDIDVFMDYQLSQDEAVLLAIEAAQTQGQTVVESDLDIQNATLRRVEDDGTVGQRVWAVPSDQRLTLRYRAKVHVARSAQVLRDLNATPVHMLPGDVIPYLRPSRFCQSDLFTTFLDERFGHLSGGSLIDAIRAWTAAEIAYVPASSNAETTAIDTFRTRVGVCRDFTHLTCALARAAHIPARYASVYSARVNPPDFHAVAQVWLDGEWHFVDATGMCAAHELVVIACGHDAGDVAFMETEHWADLIHQSVQVSQTTLA